MAIVLRVWITKTTIYPEPQEFLSPVGCTCFCAQKSVTCNVWNTSVWFLQQSWLDSYVWLAQEHNQLPGPKERLCQTRWPWIVHGVWLFFSLSPPPNNKTHTQIITTATINTKIRKWIRWHWTCACYNLAKVKTRIRLPSWARGNLAGVEWHVVRVSHLTHLQERAAEESSQALSWGILGRPASTVMCIWKNIVIRHCDSLICEA